MSYIAHDLTHRTPRPAHVYIAQCKSSLSALFARILSPQLRDAMQTTRIQSTVTHSAVNASAQLLMQGLTFNSFPTFHGSLLTVRTTQAFEKLTETQPL
ncbi:MAG: hypothetical protein ABSF28_10840 [Terracidiphilus sp.]|jgi:hypothetical protein